MLRFWKRFRARTAPAPVHRELFAAAPRGFERLACLKAVAVVAAKLAKCDGPVKRSEVTCFKRLFPLSDQEQTAVAPLFNLARETPQGYEPFAGELARMLRDERAERSTLFRRLVRIGEADGELNAEERCFLEGVARLLRVEAEWEAVSRREGEEEDPYAVLGVAREVSDDELREAWRRLIRRFHPDAAAARGEAAGDHATVAAINAAYRRIRHSRRRRVQA